ncbi:MBG domain-containing protein, partial [Methylobacterium sp. Leaf104]|uniref:MBG domain-containing protein n=2 Tax=Methylobacterium TaxID=407 RepID=UPI000ACA29D6
TNIGLLGGSVSGRNSVGGLVGSNAGGGTVSNAYATGAVSGSGNDVGGLVGFNGGTLTNTYWDRQSTGQTAGIGSGTTAGTTGLTTVQMQDLSSYAANFAGFDFQTVWVPPNQAGQGGQGAAIYPQLASLSRVVAVTPSSSRVYGTSPGLIASYAGLRPGDFVTTLGSLSTTATATSDVGRYAATAAGTAVTSPAGNSYRILFLPGTLSVTPATITVAGATGVTKTYDRSTALPGGSTGFTSAGVLFGDAVTVSAGSAVYDSARAGSRAVLVAGLSLSGAKAGNYVLSSSAVTGSGTIDPRPLALAGLTARDKTYDGTTAAALGGTATVTAIGADVVSVTGTGIGTFVSRNAGSGSPVTLSGFGLTGPDAGNYQLSLPTLFADIAPATLTFTATPAARSYGAVNPVLTGTVSGFVPGENVGSATAGTLAFTTPASASSNVGRYAVSGGGLSANDGNYVFVQAAGNATALTVDPALLTVTGTRTYDATTGFRFGQLTVSGGVVGEALTLTAGSGIAASADAGTHAGSHLTGLGLSVAGGNGLASNYRLPATGTLTITPATVTVTAQGGRSVYGDTPVGPGLSATGLAGGQDVGVLTGLSSSFGLDGRSAAGSYTLTVTGRLGNGNYRLGAIEAGTYTIDRRPPTVTADALTRVYGAADPVLGYTLGGRGLVNGDRLSGGLLTAATAGSGVGRYAIVQGTLAASADYAVSYRGADLTVAARPITVTADPQVRVYGAADPVLTYGVGGLGLVAGDRLTGALATAAEADSMPGAYAITQGSLSAPADYRLSFVGAELTVLPAPAQPGPRPVAIDPAGLASTAERAARLGGHPVASALPLLLGLGPDGVLRVSDPRFDAPLVCTGPQGGCFLTRLAPAPGPQARRSAAAR